MKKSSFLISGLLLMAFSAGCGTSDSTKADVSTIQDTVDISYFYETAPEMQETSQTDTYLIESLYDLDTELTDKDGNLLVNFINGDNIYTEDGLAISGLLKEVSKNSIIGPKITYSTTIDMNKTEKCLSVLENAFGGLGIEGCVVVSDMQGRIEVIADYTRVPDYFKDGKFLISSADSHFEETTDSIIIHETPRDKDSGEWTDTGIHYLKNELTAVNTNESYHSKGDYIGSTAKIMASIVMLDNKNAFPQESSQGNVIYDKDADDFYYYDSSRFQRFVAEDGTEYPMTSVIRNYDATTGTDCLLGNSTRNAFVKSYNTFFANAYLELDLSEHILPTLNKYFGINKFGGYDDNTEYFYHCDWTDINLQRLSDIENHAENPAYIKARMAYGMAGGAYQDRPEGHTIDNFFKISPVYLNAVTGAIATGNMYELSLKQDTVPQTIMEADTYENDYSDTELATLPEDIRRNMWDLMSQVAAITESDYQFYMKTGTANDNSQSSMLYNLLITGFVTNHNVDDTEIDGKVITMLAKNGKEISNYLGRDSSGSDLKQYYRNIAEIVMN